MAPMRAAEPETSDDAVRKATGRTWDAWSRALDEAGCATATHREIVAAVRAIDPAVSGWWSQTVAVGYERMKGLRDRHEKADGYTVSVSRVIDAPVAAAFRAFRDGRSRRRWLTEPLTIRTATQDRSLRITWDSDATNLDVHFNTKSATRCQVVVQHTRLGDSRQVETMRAFWRERLDTLRDLLERSA